MNTPTSPANPRRAPYYGWYIAVTLAITETISWGIVYYAFSVFITPMEAELGWTRTQLTAGFSFMLLTSGFMAYPVGAWLDKHGSRLLMTIGSILASLLVIAWSRVTNLTTYYLIWIALGVCSSIILYEPAFAVIATWFTARRSTALALVTFAAGFASTIFHPVSNALLQVYGWRQATLYLGIFLALTTIPLHAFILRRHPTDLGLHPDGGSIDTPRKPISYGLSLSDALRSRFFWILTLSFAIMRLANSAIRVHFIPFLLDAGFKPATAAAFSGSIGMMQVAGRVVFAPLDTRISGRIMVSGVFALQAVAMSLLIFQSTQLAVILFIGIFGMAYGAQTLARPSIIAEVFGATHYGRISSIMAIFLTLSATAGPFAAGVLYDRFGNYNLMLWIILTLAIIASAIVLFARPDEVSTQTTPAQD